MFEELNYDELMEVDGGFAPLVFAGALGCFAAGVTIGQAVGGIIHYYWR